MGGHGHHEYKWDLKLGGRTKKEIHCKCFEPLIGLRRYALLRIIYLYCQLSGSQ